MKKSTTNICIRVDSELKNKAYILFNERGITLSTAFNIFLRQSLREGGIPFSINLLQPNTNTIVAMQEARMVSDCPKAKSYPRVSELLSDLDE